SLPKGGNVTPASSVICTGGTRLLTNVGGVGFFQWQISTDNISFTDIAGATANTYLTTAGNGNSLKYYRCISIANNCFSVSSTTAVVSISATPVVSFTSVTSTTATVTWSPFGSGQYNISWTGAGSGSAAAVTTNNYTITGLTPNTNLNVTVSLASPVCGGTSPGVASVKTLCAKPTITSLVNATDALGNPGFKVNWNAVAGATTYRVYWRNMQLGAGWSFIDTVGTTKTLTSAAASTLYAGNTIAVYVAVNNCPSNATALGDASSISYVTLNPVNSCPIPTFTAVSNCPNQMSVTGLSGSPTGNYEVRFRRIFPTQTAGVAYSISSPSINLSIGSSLAGSIWEIYVRSLCTGNVYSPNATVQLVEVKPACSAISNPIMSTINCLGGTFSWNESNCIGVLGYYINIKKTTETAYNAYPVGANYFRVINWLSPNTAYNIFAQSVSCNGYLSPASPIVTFTTGGPGCREDEAGEIVESVSPQGEGINVFPNPSTGNFSVAINSSDLSDQEVRIEVMNALGQSLVTQISNMSGGNLIEGIQLDNAVASGVYFVRVHVGTNVYVNRLVLNRD
ncbi:MAG: fibronectin type III domain-containing protein, partial [Bacteroidota bacterium]